MGIDGTGHPQHHSFDAVTSPTQQRGTWAESRALEYLQEQGLVLIEKNFNCRFGEIDLILNDEDILVFAEVRYRTAKAFVGASESVDGHKQLRIVRTAEYYLQRHPNQAQRFCRFDVLGIDKGHHGQKIDWIKDAFQA